MSIDLFIGIPVLVTGGAGFIGSHLTRALAAAGANVMVMDNFSTGSPENLAGFEHRIGIMQGDITNTDDCARAMRDRVVVFHLAALGSVPQSMKDPATYNAVNIGGTLNILEAARAAGVKRVVYSASSSAYGESPELPKTETMCPAPKSPYAVTKLAGEYYCRVYAESYGISTISLRYFNVFGPRQNPKSQYAAVIPAFVSALLKKQRPKVYGDGEQTRDFCYVDNVVRANLLAGTSQENLRGEVVNIACGQRTSLNELLEMIKRLTRVDLEAEYLPERAGDVRDSLADIRAAKALLGYMPEVMLEKGLEATVRAFSGTTK